MRLPLWLRALASGFPRPRPERPARCGVPRLALEVLEDRVVPSADILYVGDASNDSVQRFNASTGASLGALVTPGDGGLNGPRGMIFRNPAKLLVVNQNVDQTFPGEVLRFNSRTGAPLGAVVPSADPNAPFAPRGMVLEGNTLYVADVEGASSPGGRVARYNVNNGRFLGNLTPSNFPGQFNPRGVVFGPDGRLYVSSFDTTNPLAGYVVRFNTNTGSSVIVAANDGDGIDEPGETRDLHRPEGLVFGPDGRLYVTSFRADATDNDKILIFSGATLADQIDLDQVGQPRAFAQALIFGPGGYLYVPISGNGPDTGAVRRYDVTTPLFTYTNFVAPGTMGQPWYPVFGNTDSATLAYNAAPTGARSGVTQVGDAALFLAITGSEVTPPANSGLEVAGHRFAAGGPSLTVSADLAMKVSTSHSEMLAALNSTPIAGGRGVTPSMNLLSAVFIGLSDSAIGGGPMM